VRVVPFLASMHAARGHRRPPTPSSMTAVRPLRAHLMLHAAALLLLAVAIVGDFAWLAAAAAAVGAAGALAYAAFFVNVIGHVRRAAATATPPGASP